MQRNLRRVIVVLPYISIIEQNADAYCTICGNVLEAHNQRELSDADRLHASRVVVFHEAQSLPSHLLSATLSAVNALT